MFERYPILPKLKLDESLLSFLVRTAQINGTDPHSLFLNWRKSKHSFVSDIDKTTGAEDLRFLSQLTGIEKAQLSESLLIERLRPVLDSNQLTLKHPWRFVMHLGARNHRRSFGYGFCPKCMASNEHRYYRRNWRLLWHVGCQIHHQRLHFNCPNCGVENKPHTLSFAASSIDECSCCGHKLSQAPKISVDTDALAIARWMDEYLTNGTNTSAWPILDVQDAANTLLQLMSITRRALSKRHVKYNHKMLHYMELDQSSVTTNSGTIHEQWSIELRELTLKGAWQLISKKPTDLVKFCLDNNINQNFWLIDSRSNSSVIQHIASQLLPSKRATSARPVNYHIEPRSREEVEALWLSVALKLKIN